LLERQVVGGTACDLKTTAETTNHLISRMLKLVRARLHHSKASHHNLNKLLSFSVLTLRFADFIRPRVAFMNGNRSILCVV